jgi:hypothetical protein
MEKIGFSRRSFEEILRDAEKQFETLDKWIIHVFHNLREAHPLKQGLKLIVRIM